MRHLLYFLLITSAGLLMAQTKTFVGLRGGGGVSSAYMSHSVFPVNIETAFIPGVHGGLAVMHFPHKYKSRINTGIQAGINISQQGWQQRFPIVGTQPHTTRINYLEFPVEAIGYAGNQNKYFFTLGFFVSYALSANVDPEPADVGPYDFYRYDINKDNRLGYGPRASLGVFRETKYGTFRLEGFFTFNIRAAYDYEPIESGIPDLSLGYATGVSLGYFFSFGKLEF
jgi:hypothetical protein